MNIKDNLFALLVVFMLLYILPLFSVAAFLLWALIPAILLRSFNLAGRMLFPPLCVGAAGGFFIYPAGVPFFLIIAFIAPTFHMYLYRQNKPDGQSYKPVTYAPIAFTILIALIILVFTEQKLAIQAVIADAIYSSLANQAAGFDAQSQVAWVFNNRADVAKYIVNAAPAIVYSVIAIIFYFTEKLYYRPSPKDIFPLPDSILALLLVSAVFFFIAGLQNSEGLYIIGSNGMIISSTLAFFRGLDVIAFHLKRLNLHQAIRGIFYAFVLMTQTLMLLVALLGIVSVYVRMVGEQDA